VRLEELPQYSISRFTPQHLFPAMTDYGGLHYPNLIPMKVTIVGSGGCTRLPVSLPAGCVEAAYAPRLESSHDFSLGMFVVIALSFVN
jgi:hypothetical protein